MYHKIHHCKCVCTSAYHYWRHFFLTVPKIFPWAVPRRSGAPPQSMATFTCVLNQSNSTRLVVWPRLLFTDVNRMTHNRQWRPDSLCRSFSLGISQSKYILLPILPDSAAVQGAVVLWKVLALTALEAACVMPWMVTTWYDNRIRSMGYYNHKISLS